MNINQICIAGILSLVGTLDQASAASFDHIDRLALGIQKQAAQLHREFRTHYSHTHEYRHLLSDATDLYRTAHHIHELVHRHASVYHLARDLRELDRSFHHIETLVRDVERDAHHGHGHVHCDTRHVKRLLRRMEDNIHHLQEDIDALTPHKRHYRKRYSQRDPYVQPGYNHGGVRVGNSGVYFNGRHVSFRIGR